ncbi:MAG: ABC transporter substrate-binding protein [Clostridia bacterium]|nr:ABC transporter substrate-binding protein [Clostridia bacterium]
MKTKLVALLCALITIFSLCACTHQDSGTELKDSVAFTDALGRELEISVCPKRVAALIGSFADLWVLAGGELCAAADDAWEDFGLETDAVNLGGAHSPSLEALVASEPELVLASSSSASNVAMLDTLDALGIPVAYFDVDCFEDYLNMLDICTDITQKKENYHTYGLELKERIELAKKKLDESLAKNKHRILLLRASSGLLKAKGSKGTVLGEMLADLGCVNIADSESLLLETLSIESILEYEPYRIFAVTMGDEAAAMENMSRIINESPAWGFLEAIEENRFHVMEKRLYNIKPNARWAEAYEKLVDILLKE